MGGERASVFARLRLFNGMFGVELYPNIIDTECRLDLNVGDCTITGTVDVIKRSDDDSSIFKPGSDDRMSKERMDAIMQMMV